MNRQWIVFAFHFSSCSASREEGLLRTVGPLPALAIVPGLWFGTKDNEAFKAAAHLSSFGVMQLVIMGEGSSAAPQAITTAHFLLANGRSRKRKLTQWRFHETKSTAFESLLSQDDVLPTF